MQRGIKVHWIRTLLLLQYWEAEWTCVIPILTDGFISGFWKKAVGSSASFPGLSACELGVPGKKPDHQRTFRCCSCGRSQGTEWFFDHCKLCPGTWTQCLCPSGSCDRGTEQRLQQTDLRWCRNRLQPGNHAYGMGNRGKKQTSKCGKKKKLGLAPDLDLVYSGLDLRPENLDNLIRKTGFSASKVCALLTELQLMGLVGETGRQYYRISGGIICSVCRLNTK